MADVATATRRRQARAKLLTHALLILGVFIAVAALQLVHRPQPWEARSPTPAFGVAGATGGIIVTLQTLIFLAAFVFAPTHGLRATRRRARDAVRAQP